MPEQASLFLTHPGHDGAPPRIVPNVPPRKPGLSEPEAAKRRKHNADVERHRAEAARVLASPAFHGRSRLTDAGRAALNDTGGA